jgi:hypothetical protein
MMDKIFHDHHRDGIFRLAEARTSLQDITDHHNFYEFSTDKEGVASAVVGLETSSPTWPPLPG